MTRISPLREGAIGGSIVGAEDMSCPPSDPTETVFPIYATTTVPISPSYGSDLPLWAIKHCMNGLRDLKVWADGVWLAEPRELERIRLENGDTETWWVAVIGPRTKKQRTSVPHATMTGL